MIIFEMVVQFGVCVYSKKLDLKIQDQLFKYIGINVISLQT